MIRSLALLAFGVVMFTLGTVRLVDTFSQTSTWIERLAASFGVAVGVVGTSLLYRWWATRP